MSQKLLTVTKRNKKQRCCPEQNGAVRETPLLIPVNWVSDVNFGWYFSNDSIQNHHSLLFSINHCCLTWKQTKGRSGFQISRKCMGAFKIVEIDQLNWGKCHFSLPCLCNSSSLLSWITLREFSFYVGKTDYAWHKLLCCKNLPANWKLEGDLDSTTVRFKLKYFVFIQSWNEDYLRRIESVSTPCRELNLFACAFVAVGQSRSQSLLTSYAACSTKTKVLGTRLAVGVRH